MLSAHSGIASPKECHLLDRTDPDGVYESNVPFLGAGSPFIEFAVDKNVKGKLPRHKLLLSKVLGYFAQQRFGGCGVMLGLTRIRLQVWLRVVRGGEGTSVSVQSIQLDVCTAGDVIVQSMGPVVQFYAFEEGLCALLIGVEIHAA